MSGKLVHGSTTSHDPAQGTNAAPAVKAIDTSGTHSMMRAFATALTLWFGLSGCGLVPKATEPMSVGFANRGYLTRGVAMPDRGPGFVRARIGDDTRFGSPVLVAALTRAALSVERALPGGAPLVIGDMSGPAGGGHDRHGSHRTGRDADVLFYLVDAQGRSVRGSGFYAFDARGVSQLGTTDAPPNLEATAYFDTPRNWAFVRALIRDEEAPIQWMFCAAGIKARLLAYAIAHESDPEVLLRASYVLHQPSKGNPHADHFHVRVACTARERALGCFDAGPTWPWLRNEHEKPSWDQGGRLDDSTLVEALIGDLTPEAGSGLQ